MEFLKEFVSPLVPLVLEHMAYPFTASSNIRALESATRKLRALKEDVQTEITNAERENGVPTNQAKEWLSQIDTLEKEEEEIREKYRQLCRCVWDISPNLWSNYKISRDAADKLVEAKRLCEEKATIEVIVLMPPPLALEIPASSSKSSNLELALQYIKDDTHSIIGIWGMGGVGKTHLLKQINNELSKDGSFNAVVFVTCSKECSEEKVQNEIINKLGLDKTGSMEQKQSTIHNFLSRKSFALLLDDLWNRVDLETIGIPDLFGKRKVVLTTRSTEVCGQMEVRKKIKVDVLNDDDAWSLFKDKASEETINSDPQIQQFAVEVFNELGRLPLALIMVGRAMNDKLDPIEWEQAIVLLKQARLNDVEWSGRNMSVFHTLKFSYDSLKDDTLKKCLLHCSLWPEDWEIEKRDLVELWMGLGLIEEHEIHIAYNTGYIYIRRLLAVCLLEETKDDWSIKMHDVIRDMALWIASNQGGDKCKWIVQARTYKERQVIEVSHDTKKISLMHSYSKEVSFSIPYSSTKLYTLLLNGNSLKDTKTLQLESFCELTVLDLSNNGLETFPVEICKLVHLRFLNLSGNTRLESLPKELEALINLKYLLLRGMSCTIPKGVLSKLKALRVLYSGCIDCVGGTEENSGIFTSLEKEIQCLSDFQALQIAISNMHDFQNISRTDVPIRELVVKNLDEENCLFFTSCFLGNSQLQNNLAFLYISEATNLEWVKFERTSNDHRICRLGRLEELRFEWIADLKEVIWKGLDPKDVFPRLQVLYFSTCDKLTSISWVVCIPCIRELNVWICSSIKQLIRIDELNNGVFTVSRPFFPYLKKMILWRNEELEDPMITFPALELLVVDKCDKLKKLPIKTSDPPRELVLRGTEEWWNNIEMEDNSHRSLLQPFFVKQD